MDRRLYRIANVVVADPAFEASEHDTTAVAVPGFVVDPTRHVHDTSPLPFATWETRRAATVETRPDGRVTRIEQLAPAEVRAPIVAVPPIGAGDGTVVKRTRNPPALDPAVGAGAGAGVPVVTPVPQR